MSFRDLRSFLTELRKLGEVHEIGVPVEANWEVGTICSENFRQRGPVLVFNKIDNYQTPLVVGTLGTERRLSLAFGISPSLAAFRDKWDSGLERRTAPRIVNQAPCKDIKIDKIDLYRDPFPVPKWHLLDGGPELGTFHAVITSGPDHGQINVGMYRNEILGRDMLGINFSSETRHAAMHWEMWKKKGTPMPVAIAIGLDPYLTILSASPVPYDINEYEVVQGLMGEPYEVIQAETSDLLVPAHAEIIIEGEIPMDDFVEREGPFGEFAGYMGPIQKNSRYIKVKQITHRKNPIFQGTYEGKFYNESKVIRSYIKSVHALDYLKKAGIPGVKDVCVTPAGCSGFHTVVSIKKSYFDHARAVIKLVLNQPDSFCKQCVVVDDDVDPWDSFEVEWAIATRMQAGRDLIIIKDGRSTSMDPSQVPSQKGRSDLLGIDATAPKDEYEREGATFPSIADPPDECVERVRRKWPEYGLAD